MLRNKIAVDRCECTPSAMYPPLVPDQDALALRTTVRSWNARLKILVGHGSAVSRMRATLVDNTNAAQKGEQTSSLQV
jgi:hypothetical protein